MTRRPRTRVRTGLVLLATAALLGPAGCGGGEGTGADGRAGTGTGGAGPRSGPTIAETVDSALFTVDCGFSHRLPDDPIVHPGRPGASHLHDFFGAEDVDAASTADDLRSGSTTCDDPEDTASYWAPTLFVGDEQVAPTVLRAYYRAAPGADVTEVQPLPADLELIVGDPHRPEGTWPSLDEVGWGCGLRPKRFHRTPPQDCTRRSPLTLRLVFPDCWDGERVRSADHRDHVARSEDGRCPDSHPVPILQVQVSISYPVWDEGAVGGPSPARAGLGLASGGWHTAHGDLLNAWDPARLERRTDLCVRAMANCTIG